MVSMHFVRTGLLRDCLHLWGASLCAGADWDDLSMAWLGLDKVWRRALADGIVVATVVRNLNPGGSEEIDVRGELN
jgi:hypothetical protein